MKARDLIPAWPRGRSTSRPLAAGSVWPWKYAYSLTSGEYLGEYGGPDFIGLGRKPVVRRTTGVDGVYWREDAAGQQAEERRKADMMEVHWAEQRMLARGPLYPQPLSERMFSFYGVGFLLDPQILAQLEAVNEAANMLCGGLPAVEAKARDGR